MENYLPSFFVIGAMKAGTSSLHAYLKAHPEIQMPRPKETNFFADDSVFERGFDWYASCFLPKQTMRFCGEACPTYAKSHMYPHAAERIYAAAPDAKLIYLLRDPIDRIISQYIHNVARGWESRSIEKALRGAHAEKYVKTSCYFDQLTKYLEWFDRRQILLIDSNDLLKNRRQTLKTIFEFIGVDSSFETHVFEEHYHASSEKVEPSWLAKKTLGTPLNRWINRFFPKLLLTKRLIGVPELSVELREQLREQLADDQRSLREWANSESEKNLKRAA